MTVDAPGGPPELLYVLCPGERLQRLQLIARVGDSPFDGDDEILWDAGSEAGTDIGEVTLGVPPAGLEEEVPLDESFEEFEDLVAVFDTNKSSRTGVAFDPADLQPERVVLFDDSVESVEDFRANAEATCP